MNFDSQADWTVYRNDGSGMKTKICLSCDRNRPLKKLDENHCRDEISCKKALNKNIDRTFKKDAGHHKNHEFRVNAILEGMDHSSAAFIYPIPRNCKNALRSLR